MASTLDPTGLTIESQTNIVADLVASYQGIYGSDINVDSNSPDGQLIAIQAQFLTDFLELLEAAYNAFAVDTAFGVRLDQLVALNGLQRKQGTFTIAQIQVTVTGAVTVPGMDQTAVTPFTVSDNAGNQYQLITSTVFAAPGTQTLAFQAANIGKVQTTANTITTIVTPTLLVSTVNNPSTAADVIGVNEETDAQLRLRHAQSFTYGMTGPSDALQSALRNNPDIVDALVVENNTGAPVNGTAANSIWVIVNGGTPTEIGAAIYAKKSPGCGMRGGQSVVVARPNGQSFTAKWDNAIAQNLFVKFSIIWRGPQAKDNQDIINQLAAALSYRLGQQPAIADVLTALATIAPTAIITINSATQGVSTDGASWASVVSPTDSQHYFTVSAANISIT